MNTVGLCGNTVFTSMKLLVHLFSHVGYHHVHSTLGHFLRIYILSQFLWFKYLIIDHLNTSCMNQLQITRHNYVDCPVYVTKVIDLLKDLPPNNCHSVLLGIIKTISPCVTEGFLNIIKSKLNIDTEPWMDSGQKNFVHSHQTCLPK